MTTYSWSKPVNGSWTTASNWTPNGGPQAGTTPPYISGDAAVFATGSRAHYTVTTGGESASLRVSGDHVTFDHFNNYNNGPGGNLTVNAGADLTVTSTSSLFYNAVGSGPGGTMGVDHARITDYGALTGAFANIGAGGVLTLSGAAAVLSTGVGMGIAVGGMMTISGGASCHAGSDVENIAGVLKITGLGSSAGLGSAGGTGKVEIYNHATIESGATTGSLSFILGNYAGLHFDGSVAAGAKINFVGQHGAMTLNSDPGQPAQGYAMGGVISGFSQTDALLLDGTPVTQVLYTAGAGGAGSLKLFNGNTAVGTLAIAGNYAGHQFAVMQVSATESRITEKPITPLAQLSEALTAAIAELKADPAHLGSILAGLTGPLPPALDGGAWQAGASSEHPLAMAAYSVIHPSGGDALPLSLSLSHA